jgi:phage terminase Nu1 subunit (DNA packaging protein)
MNAKTVVDPKVTAAELSKWLGISPQAIADNARRGFVHRTTRRGEYYLRKSIQSYTRHIREAAAGHDDATTKERVRLLTIQADAAEAKAAKLAAQYLNADSLETTWAQTRRRVLKILGEIPEECGKKLPHLTAHDLGEIKNEVDLAVAPLADEPKDK